MSAVRVTWHIDVKTRSKSSVTWTARLTTAPVGDARVFHSMVVFRHMHMHLLVFLSYVSQCALDITTSSKIKYKYDIFRLLGCRISLSRRMNWNEYTKFENITCLIQLTDALRFRLRSFQLHQRCDKKYPVISHLSFVSNTF